MIFTVRSFVTYEFIITSSYVTGNSKTAINYSQSAEFVTPFSEQIYVTVVNQVVQAYPCGCYEQLINKLRSYYKSIFMVT